MLLTLMVTAKKGDRTVTQLPIAIVRAWPGDRDRADGTGPGPDSTGRCLGHDSGRHHRTGAGGQRQACGLPTHMLVASAAAFLVALSDLAVQRFDVDLGTGLVRSDPFGIIEAVITGTGFLGAGTILRHMGWDTTIAVEHAAQLAGFDLRW